MGKDVTKTNNHKRYGISRRRSRKSFTSGADRTHVVNTQLTPAVAERGGIRL